LAPLAFAPVALASSTYTVLRTQTITTTGDTITSAKVQIDIPNVGALASDDVLTVSMPTDVVMPSAGTAAAPKVGFTCGANAVSYSFYGTAPVAAGAAPDILVEAPASLDKTTDLNALDDAANGTSWLAYDVGSTTLDIKILGGVAAAGAGRLIVYFNNVDVNTSFDGDIEVSLSGPSSSGFTAGKVAIAKYIGTNTGTYSVAKSIKSMGTNTITLDTLVTQETIKNSIQAGEVITYKLPSGFKWVSAGTATGFWDYSTRGCKFTAALTADDREMTVTAGTGANWPGTASAEGRIYISAAQIAVSDEGTAKKGDVTVSVESDLGNVTEQDFVIATYKDFGVVATAKTTKDVFAGQYDTELGTINIAEGVKGSLLADRNVTFTLPVGVKWDVENYTATNCYKKTVNKGTDWVVGASNFFDSTYRKLTLPVAASTTSASSIDFEKLRVVISPDFTGDLNVEVGGTAGITAATLKVATVYGPVSMTADTATNVVIGTQSQAIADVTVTEGLKEAMDTSLGDTVLFTLPDGVKFTALPTVTVTAGDVTLDDVDFGANKSEVAVTIKSSSTTPATIKLSNMKVTIDRTVPEGALELAVDAAGSTALQDACFDPTPATAPDISFSVDEMASVAVANVVTPAPGEQGRNASFYIGSTIMSVNGSNVIMDASPYIKAGRTYVPVRFLGDALGATTAWDAATQTVTLTKDDKTVVLVIGSKTAKVNGADVAMDVAPEITNGRTMLPARYVAEGLGYSVGWNAALQQVVIQ